MSLTVVAWLSLALALVCFFVILTDEVRHSQSMGVMNIVWPITGLYFSVFAVWAYFELGRQHTRQARQSMKSMDHGSMQQKKSEGDAPNAGQVAVGTSHCGAGCTLADVGTEFAIAASGLVLFGSVLWTEFVLDFLVAWALGVLFQYFAIKPMRSDLSVGGAIWAAIKADTFSILAFQVGMYLWMALVYYKLFPGPHLTPFDPRYWLMMQIAMILGFATSYPMNWLLIRLGVKEAM